MTLRVIVSINGSCASGASFLYGWITDYGSGKRLAIRLQRLTMQSPEYIKAGVRRGRQRAFCINSYNELYLT